MSTILVCATPLAGHVGPLTAVGRVLADRGHEVIMLTGSRFAERVGDAGLTVESLTGVADLDERDPDSFTPDRHRYRGLALSRYQVERTFIAPLPEQATAVASGKKHQAHKSSCGAENVDTRATYEQLRHGKPRGERR